ncbi:hypothetical protein [Microbispora sitophila]|uniref:hypothetical protein n=1 Tax=Microbispora sitophila TaxID=2771537 RepID=UPI001D01FF41|nr:hypothetical protein [Microbispora sitophila]
MTDEGGYADAMNTLPKYVVSTTLTEAIWNNSTIGVVLLTYEPTGEGLADPAAARRAAEANAGG